MIDMLPPSDIPADIRELTAKEIESISHMFKEAGADMPSPNLSTFIGAVSGDRVIGFLVLQLRLHAEPLWILPGYSNLFMPLVGKAEEILLNKVGTCRVYTFVPAGKTAQLAQAMGMQMEPWVVMSKLVTPECPKEPPVTLSSSDLEVMQ